MRTPAPPVRLLTSDSALIFTRKTDSLSSDKITLISLGTTLTKQACREYIGSGGHLLVFEFVFASPSPIPMLIHQSPCLCCDLRRGPCVFDSGCAQCTYLLVHVAIWKWQSRVGGQQGLSTRMRYKSYVRCLACAPRSVPPQHEVAADWLDPRKDER